MLFAFDECGQYRDVVFSGLKTAKAGAIADVLEVLFGIWRGASIAVVDDMTRESLHDQKMLVQFDAAVRAYCVVAFEQSEPAPDSRATLILSLLLQMGAQGVSLEETFVNSVLTRKHPKVLQELTQMQLVRILGTKDDMMIALMTARMEQLRIPKPEFSWSIPDARFHDPQVQAFLRSNKQVDTFRGFNGLGHARNFARNHSGTYGCSFSAGGRGGSAYVKAEKSKAFCNKNTGRWETLQKELG